METFSALLAPCAGNSPVPGEFPAQRPVTRRFDVLFDPRLNKRLNKQSLGWWYELPSVSLWRKWKPSCHYTIMHAHTHAQIHLWCVNVVLNCSCWFYKKIVITYYNTVHFLQTFIQKWLCSHPSDCPRGFMRSRYLKNGLNLACRYILTAFRTH